MLLLHPHSLTSTRTCCPCTPTHPPPLVLCRALPTEANVDWVLSTSHYGEDFVAAVCKGAAMATQFHPEKSGATGGCG